MLTNKTAIVTGGGTGLGLCLSRELLHLGCTVIIASRKINIIQQAIEVLRSDIEHVFSKSDPSTKPKVFGFELNIRSPSSIAYFMKCVADSVHTVNFLVNNAGGQFPSPADSISYKGWNAVIDTNLTGTFLMSQSVFSHFFEKQLHGNIVNIVANFHNGFPAMSHTSAARAGVSNLCKTLAIEWAEYGVRINAVAPGTIASSGLSRYDPVLREEIISSHSTKNYAYRFGTEQECAASIIFLLSPLSSYITGVTLNVDGGESIYHALKPPSNHVNLPSFDSGPAPVPVSQAAITSKL